jgi:hypothetical protein
MSNHGVQLTASSVRCAPASGSGSPPALGAKRSVVIAKLGDEQGVCLDFIDYPMFIINAA